VRGVRAGTRKKILLGKFIFIRHRGSKLIKRVLRDQGKDQTESGVRKEKKNIGKREVRRRANPLRQKKNSEASRGGLFTYP